MKKLIQVVSITSMVAASALHAEVDSADLAQVQNLTPQNLKAFALEHIAIQAALWG